MEVYKYASKKYVRMEVCTDAKMQVYSNAIITQASMQWCNSACMQVCKMASSQLCKYACTFAIIQVDKYDIQYLRLAI